MAEAITENCGAFVLLADAESDASPGRQRVLRVGTADTHRGVAVHFVRVNGVDASYVIDERLVRAVREELAE